MTTDAEDQRTVERALARGVVCRALKLGLQPPSPLALQALFSEEGSQAVERAVELLEDPNRPAGLQSAWRRLCRCSDRTVPDLEPAYNALFGHTLRGRVCPYETEYGPAGPFRQSQELADIAAYYRAFGLDTEGSERLDHIGVELDFVEFLSLKEAYALVQRDEEMLSLTRKALADFLQQHLGGFGRAFSAGLAREDEGGFYGALGILGEAFFLVECARLGVPVGPATLQLSPEEPDNLPMSCGSPEDLVQIDPGVTG
jgi:TorA maturation chaperone TorD